MSVFILCVPPFVYVNADVYEHGEESFSFEMGSVWCLSTTPGKLAPEILESPIFASCYPARAGSINVYALQGAFIRGQGV